MAIWRDDDEEDMGYSDNDDCCMGINRYCMVMTHGSLTYAVLILISR